MAQKEYPVISKLRKLLFNPYCTFLNRIADKADGKFLETSKAGYRMCLVTVAYNKPDLIKAKIEFVKDNITDKDYVHIVLDNSSNRHARKAIKEACFDGGATYIPVPHYFHIFFLPRLFWYGVSEGMALNWFCRKILPSINPRFLAITDQDLFPLRKYSVIDKLENKPFYGVGRQRETGWYLWPGFIAFDCQVLQKPKFDFMPCFFEGCYFDTGGRNFINIFKDYSIGLSMLAHVKTKRYAYGKDDNTLNIYHRDCIQIIDNAWLHLINGSNYAHLKNKERIIDHIMNHIKTMPLPDNDLSLQEQESKH